jgi:hypothetical protein
LACNKCSANLTFNVGSLRMFCVVMFVVQPCVKARFISSMGYMQHRSPQLTHVGILLHLQQDERKIIIFLPLLRFSGSLCIPFIVLHTFFMYTLPLHARRKYGNIFTCRVVLLTKMTGSSLDDWIY